MSEAPDNERLAALAELAARLPWPLPRFGGDAFLCGALARSVDCLLANVARGRGALDIAIGEHLDALESGGRVLRLGFVSIRDYAREMHGIPASTAEKMARFARRLRDCPGLRAAVRDGDVTVRQAEAVLPVARGDTEAYWVERARSGATVRELKAEVKRTGGSDPEDLDEEWNRLCLEVPPERRAALDEALALAGKVLGGNAPKHERLAVMCQEYIGAHATPDEGDAVPTAPVYDWLEEAKEHLERVSKRWACLAPVEKVAVTQPIPEERADPHQLHAKLVELFRDRNDWDPTFGHLAMLMHRSKAWFTLEYTSFAHYCEERLGMSERAVQQRAALEWRLYDLPALRKAMCDGRISYEKARILARYADGPDLNQWIDRATTMTCVALRRELEDEEEAQMCARGNFEVVIPESMRSLLAMAFHAVRDAANEWLPPGECIARIAEHFIETWKPAVQGRVTGAKRIIERDRGRCQVPGCSRAAGQSHHVTFRSQGGSDDPKNQAGVCPPHHLQCIHNGWVRVWGEAPDKLYWELGVRPGFPPLAVFGPAPPG